MMIPTLLEGITKRIFAANFTQASFKLTSNHGFPCREQSSVSLRTIMQPCLERRVEGSAVLATVCYSGMILIGMLQGLKHERIALTETLIEADSSLKG